MSKVKQIFIVGSSRSGTTMMGRILGNHSDVFTFKELHFFGTIWTNNSDKKLNRAEQVHLLSRLFCIQERGIFNQNNFIEFKGKSEKILAEDISSPLKIYELFLATISKENGSSISCEQTPKNLYYLEEILDFFPDAKVINLVRDQRDVLLSQKNKWKRRFLGAKSIPMIEAIRSFVNYHPILTAKVWNSSLYQTSKFRSNSRVKIVKFEDLLVDSRIQVHEICKFLEIDFQENMLKVPVIGSSTENDSKSELVIDSSKISKWKKGGLTSSEIYLSQNLSSNMMDEFGYEKETFTLPPIMVVLHFVTFPFKLGLAFVLNYNRLGIVVKVIKKRFFK